MRILTEPRSALIKQYIALLGTEGLTLAFTLGTWALDFLAAGRGGWLERAARYTPTAGLRVFEHGQLSLATAAVFLAASAGAIVFAGICLTSYRPVAGRAARGRRHRRSRLIHRSPEG